MATRSFRHCSALPDGAAEQAVPKLGFTFKLEGKALESRALHPCPTPRGRRRLLQGKETQVQMKSCPAGAAGNAPARSDS